MARKKKEPKPVYSYYIVNRQAYGRLVGEAEARHGRRPFHGGEIIREATMRRHPRVQDVSGKWIDDTKRDPRIEPWKGTSPWHALCKAAHMQGFPAAPGLYAVVPAEEWKGLVRRADAVLAETAHWPSKDHPAPPEERQRLIDLEAAKGESPFPEEDWNNLLESADAGLPGAAPAPSEPEPEPEEPEPPKVEAAAVLDDPQRILPCVDYRPRRPPRPKPRRWPGRKRDRYTLPLFPDS